MNSNPQDEYLRMIGARVLQEQLASQQQQQPPVDIHTAQSNRNHAILAERAAQAQQRETEAARAKAAESQAARARELERQNREYAEQEKSNFRAQALASWQSAGGNATDFTSSWPDIWQREMQRRLEPATNHAIVKKARGAL